MRINRLRYTAYHLMHVCPSGPSGQTSVLYCCTDESPKPVFVSNRPEIGELWRDLVGANVNESRLLILSQETLASSLAS